MLSADLDPCFQMLDFSLGLGEVNRRRQLAECLLRRRDFSPDRSRRRCRKRQSSKVPLPFQQNAAMSGQRIFRRTAAV